MWGEEYFPDASKMEFIPGVHMSRDAYLAPQYPNSGRMKVLRYTSHPLFKPGVDNDDRTAYDLCLIELATNYKWPVGATDKQFFGVGADCATQKHSWTSAGYPARDIYGHERNRGLPEGSGPEVAFLAQQGARDIYTFIDQNFITQFVKTQNVCVASDVCAATPDIQLSRVNCPHYAGQSGSPLWMQDPVSMRRFIECVHSNINPTRDTSQCIALHGKALAWLAGWSLSEVNPASSCRQASADVVFSRVFSRCSAN
jgi:hypothetical protein